MEKNKQKTNTPALELKKQQENIFKLNVTIRALKKDKKEKANEIIKLKKAVKYYRNVLKESHARGIELSQDFKELRQMIEQLPHHT